MARCQPQPQLEDRSPRLSTSGHSLLEGIDDEVPGPSVPWVDPGTPSKFLCWNWKREWLEKERAPEPEETWVLDTLCGLKMKLKRQRVSPVLPEHPKAFNRLLGRTPERRGTWVSVREKDGLQKTTVCGAGRIESGLGFGVGVSGDQEQKHCFLYLSPWVDPGTPNILCCKRKREWSDESEEEPEEETEKECTPETEETWVLDALCGLKMKLKRQRVSPVLPEHYEAFNTLLDESEEEPEEETEKERTPKPEETWVLETLQGLKMKLKRRRVSPVLPEHHQAFNRLLEDPVVKRFLAWDKDLRASDKYLLAMVIAYFSRAVPIPPSLQSLCSQTGSPSWCFLACYLANDMEEDDEGPKQAIFYFLYGKNCSQRPLFQKLRFQFFCSMHCRAWVSPEELEEIQAYDPEHWVWARNRALLS
uniref:Uncharacterized protein n=1 Tax=Cebus imitator TaxID=2715852 RepID=A0A2K5PSB6_CEBIM